MMPMRLMLAFSFPVHWAIAMEALVGGSFSSGEFACYSERDLSEKKLQRFLLCFVFSIWKCFSYQDFISLFFLSLIQWGKLRNVCAIQESYYGMEFINLKYWLGPGQVQRVEFLDYTVWGFWKKKKVFLASCSLYWMVYGRCWRDFRANKLNDIINIRTSRMKERWCRHTKWRLSWIFDRFILAHPLPQLCNRTCEIKLDILLMSVVEWLIKLVVVG